MVAGILPVELLLEEIFSRLPVKSLISLTIICKSWLALISSQSFAKTHLSRYHLNPNTHLLLLHAPYRDKITISPLNIPMISIIQIPPSEGTSTSVARNLQANQESQNSMYRLVGSINGLVCLSSPNYYKPTNVLIWNPATHTFRNICIPDLNLIKSIMIYVAFGFDCVGDDYKIVCIYQYRVEGGDRKRSLLKFRMYSCNDNSWKDLEYGLDIDMWYMMGYVTVKGSLFWMVYNDDIGPNWFWLTVNVESEVIRVLSGPKYAGNADVVQYSIMALGDDKIAQIVHANEESDSMIYVYALEESCGVWTLMYTIESIGLQKPEELQFQCYNNGKFVIKDGHMKLFTYDLECAEIKDLGVGEGMGAHYMTINYIESLVYINGMEKVKEEAAQEAGQNTALPCE